MTAPALIFAVPLLGGAATAVLCIDLTDDRFAVVASAAAALALMAAAGWTIEAEHPDATVATALGYLFVGLSLGTSAGRDAYDTPLQHWFRRAAPAIPVIVEGVLREDAAPTPLGVALLLDVLAIDGVRLRTPGGGLRLSVGGTLAAREVREWRAGRTLRTAALLRRPSTYLNPGTPDQLRPLARRGIVLVGTVKSGATWRQSTASQPGSRPPCSSATAAASTRRTSAAFRRPARITSLPSREATSRFSPSSPWR
jgi:hypothetical protein